MIAEYSGDYYLICGANTEGVDRSDSFGKYQECQPVVVEANLHRYVLYILNCILTSITIVYDHRRH